MKIKFLKSHHIRSSPVDLDLPSLGVVEEGTILEVSEQSIEGAEIAGVSIWYVDAEGQYYWGGDVEKIQEETTTSLSTSSLEKQEEKKQPQSKVVKPENALIDSDQEESAKHPAQYETLQEETDGMETDTDSNSLNWGIRSLQIDSFFWEGCQVRGEGVRVVILDTGVETEAGPGQTHSALQSAYHGGRGFSSDGPNNVIDEIGHGTLSAGVICANSEAVVGVAPGAEFYMGKVVEGTGENIVDQLIAGLEWAIDMGADIILANMAIPKEQVSLLQRDSLEDLVDKIEEQKIILIAPVGRNESALPSGRYPACLPCSISVGAYDEEGERDEDTQQSFSLDLLAPGIALKTTDLNGGITEEFSGPGAAAAFAAGCFALLLHFFRKKGLGCCNPKDMIERVKQSACPRVKGKKIRSSIYGFGKIDPVKTVEDCLSKKSLELYSS